MKQREAIYVLLYLLDLKIRENVYHPKKFVFLTQKRNSTFFLLFFSYLLIRHIFSPQTFLFKVDNQPLFIKLVPRLFRSFVLLIMQLSTKNKKRQRHEVMLSFSSSLPFTFLTTFFLLLIFFQNVL